MTVDAGNLPELTRRQEEILGLIVRAYTNTPEPISSKYLLETFNLSVSSATIRNEMVVLEELGYISAPHTSAGRVPTENGYRYFVTPDRQRPSDPGRAGSHRQKFQSPGYHRTVDASGGLDAGADGADSLVTPPMAGINHFKH
jgi:heat-inducible transcriptional repressor